MKFTNPIITQRADPQIYRHSDGYYYFTASVPEYDRIELRRAHEITALADSSECIDVWHKPDTGPYSELIWAPELHRLFDQWVIYFAAAPSREIIDGLFQHRMYALVCLDGDPITGHWEFAGQVDTGIDTFCLDATTFNHHGTQYYVWAQKAPDIYGNSNLYIAPLSTPTKLAGKPVMLSKPEYEWEQRGFWVNEGPSVLQRHGKVFISYSASATDENYAMGLLWAADDADMLDPNSWHKSPDPVFTSNYERAIYGPGHNSFTTDKEGHDLLVYHARNYTEIEGDPLWNPDRHTCVQPLSWDEAGMPVFGTPE